MKDLLTKEELKQFRKEQRLKSDIRKVNRDIAELIESFTKVSETISPSEGQALKHELAVKQGKLAGLQAELNNI